MATRFVSIVVIAFLGLILGSGSVLADEQGQHKDRASVVARVSGTGSATMTDLPVGKGLTTFEVKATLFADGSARGQFVCIDLLGDVPGYPGRISGPVTRWSRNTTDGTVTFYITGGKIVPFPDTGFVVLGVSFSVTIQRSGGAGVGHWTLDLPGFPSPFNGGPICQEILTRGHITVRWTNSPNKEEEQETSFRD
jgi:hypothetical protein